MTDNMNIRKSDSIWVVRAGGAVLGETSQALELTEGDREPVIYFPRADIAMDFLELSDTTTEFRHKGVASYYSIVTKSRKILDAAHTFDAPYNGAEVIAGFMAFDPEKVTVESI